MPQMIASAERVIDCQKIAEETQQTLMEKLGKAAEQLECKCLGTWKEGAAEILRRNGINVATFKDAFRAAFESGARRGLNIGLVGRGGSGKSSLVEPFGTIFKISGKPQRSSTFPFTNAVGADLMLWQDYRHNESTVSFSDLLSILVGETVEVRVPGERNVLWANRAPMVYTGRAPLRSTFRDPEEKEEYDDMMADRFTVFKFFVRVPDANPNHPKCGRCCAQFYLEAAPAQAASSSIGPAQGESSSSGPAQPSTAWRHEADTTTVTRELLILDRMRRDGSLTEDEFVAAKRRLLG